MKTQQGEGKQACNQNMPPMKIESDTDSVKHTVRQFYMKERLTKDLVDNWCFSQTVYVT